jgi:4-amino-4-deoxy-L-arabinose transferase-like glycosyltransferase
MEMIERGDYVVPRVLGELYFAKPPLQAWAIALVSGFDTQRVSAFTSRLVTIVSWLAILLLLWRLGIEGRPGRPHLLPPLIFATTGSVIQFGRAGEIDVFFCLIVTAAWAAFEFGRRHEVPWTQWTLSQGLVALGFLAKGLAPLFFYPPVLFCTLVGLRGRMRFSLWGFGAGAVLGGLVVAGWLVPHSWLTPADELRSQWIYEVWRITLGSGCLKVARHLATYPFLIVGVALPWSLLPILWGRAGWSRLNRWRRDSPYHGLAAATVAWGLLVYLFVPGVDGRYLIPTLPFASVLLARVAASPTEEAPLLRRRLERLAGSRTFWGLVALLLLLYCWLAGRDLAADLRVTVWIAAAVGLVMLSVLAWWCLAGRGERALVPLVALGLLAGIVLAGVWEARQTRRNGPFVETASAFAARIRPGARVSCQCLGGDGRKIALPLSRAVGRVLQVKPPETGSYHAVLPHGTEAPPRAELLVEGSGFDLWWIERP